MFRSSGCSSVLHITKTKTIIIPLYFDKARTMYLGSYTAFTFLTFASLLLLEDVVAVNVKRDCYTEHGCNVGYVGKHTATGCVRKMGCSRIQPDGSCFNYALARCGGSTGNLAVCWEDEDCTGEPVTDGSELATCDQINGCSWGEIGDCTAVDCVKTGNGFGDPHFRTWNGSRFDFHGACDLVMLRASNLGGIPDNDLSLHVRTTKRYSYSFIETAALQIGEDTLEVAGWGTYFLNGVSAADMPALVGGYLVSYTQSSEKDHSFVIQLDGDHDVKLSTFKDWVNVEVSGKRLFKESLGLMGNFSGTRVARDGETILDDPIAFGQEWQVLQTEQKLFQVTRDPQHPQSCDMPEETVVDDSRRLGSSLARSAAEEACAHREEDKEECIFDVMATGDIEMAQAGAF